ncbi:MAG: hypothetical protein HWD61_05080 [Parachlamydiaceae bacterium]|nr:MAG: hypothetical protein HWD61_05080 [Parachlamydiaceae bacterium]
MRGAGQHFGWHGSQQSLFQALHPVITIATTNNEANLIISFILILLNLQSVFIVYNSKEEEHPPLDNFSSKLVHKLVGSMVLGMVLHMASHSMALEDMGMVHKDHSSHCGRSSSLLKQMLLPLMLQSTKETLLLSS